MAVVIYGPHGPEGPPGDDGLFWRGAWVTATAYAKDDAVSYGGSSYIATSAHTAGATTEPGVGVDWATVWDLVAQKGAQGDPGAAGAVILDDLTDVDVTTVAPTDKQALVYDLASTLWKPGSVAAGSGGGGVYEGVSAKIVTPFSIPTALWTKVDFDAEDYDTNGFHDLVTNKSRLTIPAGMGGKYSVFASAYFDETGSSAGDRFLEIRKNGVAQYGADHFPGTSRRGSTSAEVDVVAGDYIELYVFQSSGGPLTVKNTEGGTRLSMHKSLGGSGTATGAIVAANNHRPVANVSYSPPLGSTYADVDPALEVSFTATTTTAVVVLNAIVVNIGGATQFWNLRSGGVDVPNTGTLVANNFSADTEWARQEVAIVVTGLTPGQTYTYRWGAYSSVQQTTIIAGPDRSMTMLVFAVGPNMVPAGSAGVGARAAKASSATQSLTHNTWTKVTYNVERFDVGGVVADPTTGVFTAPKAGKYLLTGGVVFASNATGLRAIRFVKNGGATVHDQLIGYQYAVPNSATDHRMSTSTIVDLVAGDTITFEAYQGSGAALNIGFATADFDACYLAMWQIDAGSSSTAAGGILAQTYYSPVPGVSTAMTWGNTQSPIEWPDVTKRRVTFTVPASGIVNITVEGWAEPSNQWLLGVAPQGTQCADAKMIKQSATHGHFSGTFRYEGLTPGAVVTYEATANRKANALTFRAGTTSTDTHDNNNTSYGPFIITAYAGV